MSQTTSHFENLRVAGSLASISEPWALTLLAKAPQPKSNLEPDQPRHHSQVASQYRTSTSEAARAICTAARDKDMVVK
jgi:hypothetical protein